MQLRQRRLALSSRPGESAHRLEGDIRFSVTENLSVRVQDGRQRFSCAGCAVDLGPVSSNYKLGCARYDAPIESANPIVGDPARYIDARPVFRQFFCPGCGRLIENEIALDGEPVLHDIVLAL
jgi:acetone carboxylase gamma subunit